MAGQNRIRQRRLERQAEGYLELNMPLQALETLVRLRNLGELSPHAMFLKGESLRSLGRHQEALVPLRRVVKAQPENLDAWLAMGWCYKRIGRLDLAIRALERAVRIAPGEALVHYNLACYHSLAREKRAALAHLSRALAIDGQYRSLIESESDFDPLRSDPDFQALTRVVV